jgi:hypothetical protein
MTFFALRVECPSCRHAFLVGGGRGNDVSNWRQYEVECPSCRSKATPDAARLVSLSPPWWPPPSPRQWSA